MQITAAVAPGPGEAFRMEQLTLDELRPGEVLVRIVGTGLCHTDIIASQSAMGVPMPAVFGHEGAGVIAANGAGVSRLAVGDHVVLSYDHCGLCRNCQAGLPTYCEALFGLNFAGARPDGSPTHIRADGSTVHGAFFAQSSFADHCIARESNCVRVDKDVDLALLGPLGCGIQTGAGAVMNVLKPGPGQSLAVFGSGSVGIAGIMAAKAMGVTTIIAIDLLQSRLDLALELGATHGINAGEEDAVKAVRAITGRGADFSLEATGIPAVLRQAVDALAIPGTCGFVGAAAPGVEVSLDMQQLMLGRTIKGIIEGESVPQVFIPHLIALYKQGRFPLDKLVTFYAMADINSAVADCHHGHALKPVLRP